MDLQETSTKRARVNTKDDHTGAFDREEHFPEAEEKISSEAEGVQRRNESHLHPQERVAPESSTISPTNDSHKRQQGTEDMNVVVTAETLGERLSDIWGHVKDPEQLTGALSLTSSLLQNLVDDMLRFGMGAFHDWQRLEQKYSVLKEDIEGKNHEITLLRESDQKNRETIANLLHSAKSSYNVSHDSSTAAIAEANLKAELAALTQERNAALSEAASSTQKTSLLQNELHDTKNKLGKILQEKLKLERDQRAAMSLAMSLDSNASSDLDFYKRRVSDLVMQVQGFNSVVAEKNRQIDELRRQIERTLSQNRLTLLHGERGTSRKRSSMM